MNYYNPSHSDRLNYRLLTTEDQNTWKRFFTQKNPTLYFPEFMRKPESANIWIEKQIERYKEHRFGLMAIELKSTGEFIGQCGLLTQSFNSIEILEIGYHLFEEFTGNGFASEAAIHFKKMAPAVSEFNEVHSIIHIDNAPSKKVARANGMTITERTLYHGIEVDLFTVKL